MNTDLDTLIMYLDTYTIQERGEMKWLFEKVQALQPSRILEIGRAQGGSAALLAATGALVVSVDNEPQMPYAWTRDVYCNFVPNAQIVTIDGDAHLLDTANRVQQYAVYDVLFVDGGHHHDDASRDILMYMPMVKAGGLVFLHDIISPHSEEEWYPKWFWNRIRQVGVETAEFTDIQGADGGIGMFVVPDMYTQMSVFNALVDLAIGTMDFSKQI